MLGPLRFVARNFQPDFVWEVFKCGQEQLDGLGMASDDTLSKKKALDAWVNGKCKKGRPKGVRELPTSRLELKR